MTPKGIRENSEKEIDYLSDLPEALNMLRKNVFIAAAILLGSSLLAVVQGDVLAKYTVTTANFSFDNNQYLPYAIFPVKVADPTQPPDMSEPNGYTLFDTIHWTTADVGSTVTETPATSSDAAGAIARLADGVNEDILFKIRNEGGTAPLAWATESTSTVTETNAFFPTGGGPDFSKFAITDVRETLNSMTLSTPLSGGAATHATYTVTVDGTVPEPGVVWLMPLFVGLACSRRSRRSAE